MEPTPWTVGKFIETASFYWQTITLHTGVKLDIFSILDGKTASVKALADLISADVHGTETLLNALSAMGLLTKSIEGYTNTDAASAWLSQKSNQYLGHIILHHHHLVETWERLDEAVKTGSQVQIRSRHTDAEKREHFLMGMFNMAMNLAPHLTSKIDLSDRTHLIDVGGGPGTYAIHFCLHNPQLRATIFDLPTTRPFAQKTIDRFGLTDRINFIDGDYLLDPVPGTYDAAWLSHILHGEGPEECLGIIKKVIAALRPGGVIVIHEFIMNQRMDGPLFPALFSLNMLVQTEKGRSYSEDQLSDMIAACGAVDIRKIDAGTPNDSGLLSAIKPL